MKRLVWILIALVGTALAQVQPVISPLTTEAESCCCTGEQAGACGMPDCAPAPTAAPCPGGLTVAAAARAETRKANPAPVMRRESVFLTAFARPAVAPMSGVSLRGTPAARAPLFKAHCSFLI